MALIYCIFGMDGYDPQLLFKIVGVKVLWRLSLPKIV